MYALPGPLCGGELQAKPGLGGYLRLSVPTDWAFNTRLRFPFQQANIQRIALSTL